MNIWWVAAALVSALAVWSLFVRWRRRRRSSDLGTLSDQWMAEQRRTR